MTNRFLISVAAAALIAGTGLANAQGPGAGHEGGAGAAAQSAPSAERGAPSAAAPMNREGAADSKGPDAGMKSTQSEEKSQPGGAKNQRAQDTTPGQKPNAMRSDNDAAKGGKDQKAEDRNGNTNAAESKTDKGAADKNMNAESKPAADSKTTTGQAAAGGKQLSTEQRTKVTSVIKEQHIAPVTNINFSVSVGTRVPREVGFHPLPTEIVDVYPDWRGYEFFLARDQIIVVDPRTFEIVAVLDD
jgi:Protein of unknown function (DUF1236)